MKTAWFLATLIPVAATLTGCATGPLQVSSDVQTFTSAATLATPATYRFERLPSQQAEGQQLLEQLAQPALDKVGLTRNDAAAQYNVQVAASLRSVVFGPDYGYSPYGWGGWGGWGGPRFSAFYGRGAWGPGWGPGWGWGASWAYVDSYPSDVVREVSVVLRDATNGQVVYETRANNYGFYGNDGAVLPLMFEAALSGFPQPPQGLRRVTVTQPPPVQALPPATPGSAPAPAAGPGPTPAPAAKPAS